MDIYGTTVIDRGAQAEYAQAEGGASGNTLQTGTIVVEAADISLPPEGLDSEMLFAYLRTHMRNLDSQLRTELGVMDERRLALAEASTALHELRALQSEARDVNQGDPEHTSTQGYDMTPERRAEFETLLAQAGISPDQAGKLINGWGDRASTDDIKAAVDMVNDQIGSLNSENEYNMIRINDLMGKRAQLVQMVSKMMSNMDETARSVIQNMR